MRTLPLHQYVHIFNFNCNTNKKKMHLAANCKLFRNMCDNSIVTETHIRLLPCILADLE